MGHGPRVQLAYLHPQVVSHSWHASIIGLLKDGRVAPAGDRFAIWCKSGGLADARNLAAQRFLDETLHEWLWFIDTDMGIAPDALDRLLNASYGAAAVGALYFGLWEDDGDGMNGHGAAPFPMLFKWSPAGYTPIRDYPADAPVPVDATGAGCLLIHRTALEKVRAEHGEAWFDEIRLPNIGRLSEDMSFCYRLRELGAPVFVHTGARANHHKQVWISEGAFHGSI